MNFTNSCQIKAFDILGKGNEYIASKITCAPLTETCVLKALDFLWNEGLDDSALIMAKEILCNEALELLIAGNVQGALFCDCSFYNSCN